MPIFKIFDGIRPKTLAHTAAEYITILVKNHYKREFKVNKVKKFKSGYES